MSMTFTDRATIAGTHRTADQYLAADARIARTGIQIYSGREVGKPEMASVRVYRAPEEVFAAGAMASVAHKPITLDHPAQNVDATRWKKTAVGWTGDTIQRDGNFLRVPMMVADADAIASIDSGARQLSAGYTCDLVWGTGTTPEGETYDARQVGIRVNHVAIVPAGRAGSECRIGDSAGGSMILRDAAGAPTTLYDEQTGGQMKLNEDLIAAIEAEAAKLGMSVNDYVQHVLKYSWAKARLAGSQEPSSPARKA
jgi:uncharacterized protein